MFWIYDNMNNGLSKLAKFILKYIAYKIEVITVSILR